LGSLLSVYPSYAQNTYDEYPPCPFPLDPPFFWNDPADPSIFDQITFGLDGCITPDDWVCEWNFGDGSTGGTCFFEDKQYAADGDYTVNVKITVPGYDPQTLTRVVSVRTHDVSITKFTVPESARAGQTRQIIVYVRNNRYPEYVEVMLFKNPSSGETYIGTLQQSVPVRPGNRTTAFRFSYTFTEEDASIGKVTFKAIATPMDGIRDAWTADNEAISLPTRVFR
jgi:hypothetical protein